jgi:hypothetical protein
MVMSGLTLLSKSKAHCLRITKETAKPIAWGSPKKQLISLRKSASRRYLLAVGAHCWVLVRPLSTRSVYHMISPSLIPQSIPSAMNCCSGSESTETCRQSTESPSSLPFLPCTLSDTSGGLPLGYMHTAPGGTSWGSVKQ